MAAIFKPLRGSRFRAARGRLAQRSVSGGFASPLIQIFMLWVQERSALAPSCVELGPRRLR